MAYNCRPINQETIHTGISLLQIHCRDNLWLIHHLSLLVIIISNVTIYYVSRRHLSHSKFNCCLLIREKITTNTSDPTQQSPLRPVLPSDGYSASLLTQICLYFGNYSQSTACIETRFGECSSTLFHQLWYLYSYIYKLTTTIISYRIYLFLNSQ